MIKLDLINVLLKQISNDISSGKCKITEEQAEEAYNVLYGLVNGNKYLSREESASYLHMSVQNFDLLRKKGEISNGIKRKGITNLQWSVEELDKYVEEHKNKKPNKYCLKVKM